MLMGQGWIQITLGAVLMVGAIGCGVSPLLHHSSSPSTPISQLAPSPSGCELSFPKSGMCGVLTWAAAPNDRDPASFSLRFWNASTSASQGPNADPSEAVFVMLWMPSMGHGSSPITLVRSTPGLYQGSDVYFLMPGAWEVRVDLTSGSQVVEEAVVSIQI